MKTMRAMGGRVVENRRRVRGLTLPSPLRHHAGMSVKAAQYTIRNIPPSVDKALQRRAAERGTSLNLLLVELLTRESGVAGEGPLHHDLDHLVGTWVKDAAVDRALAQQRKVVPGDWP
jgi:hypothetical protein